MSVLSDPLGIFTLQMAEGWTSETEDCVTTLKGPLGAGVLFVSGGRRAGGPQPGFGGSEFLARFLRSIGVEVPAGSIACTPGVGCLVYSYRRDTDDSHWRYWSVTDEETALLISYTCRLRDAGREEEDVDAMLGSVRLYRSARMH